MERQVFANVTRGSQTAGWSAIMSGVLGVVAFLLLLTAVTTRNTWNLSHRVNLLFRAHDIGVALQFLLLIPLITELRTLSQRHTPVISRGTIAIAVSALCLVSVLLVLGIGRIVNDMFYMLPQGVFGVCLIVLNVQLRRLLPRWLTYSGMVVGLGLVLVGTVFPGLATFVYPNMWKIPAVPVDQEVYQSTGINHLLHLLLGVGSILGVVTLPFWTLLAGSRLLKRTRSEAPAAP